MVNYGNYIGFTYFLKCRNRVMEYTSVIKTTENLEQISNELDDLIETMVFSGQRMGEFIKVLQGLIKRLDKEIESFNA